MSHRESTTTIIVLNLLACLFAAVAPTSADGVSPGAPDHIAAVDQRCPTFIWELVERTLYYEVVAYVLPEYLSDEAVFEASLEGAEEVLYTRVPGGAAGWTPPADRALAPGGRYVWFVRAVYEDGDVEDVKAGEWSRGHFFRVAEGPSAAELASALANLERASAGSGAQPSPPAIAVGHGAASPKASGTGTASVPTAPAAIRGEHPEPSAEAYGVVGTAASPVGAGVAAVNTGGGADLVLDGSADLETDARLSQSGIDRPAATPETFSIGNSGGGGMTLEVAGAVSADSFAGDGSALTGIIASDADTLDGEHGAFYRDAGNLNAGTVPTGRYSAAADLAAEGHLGDAAGDLAQNNGVLQPTLNADLLDGADGAFFLDAGNLGTGTLSTSRYSAHADLAAEGYLDLSADGDLLTRAQGDDRFVDESGDTVTGTLMIDGDGKRLASRATPNDETTTNVTKLEVRASDGTPLFSVDSEGDLSAASLTGDGAGLTGVTADDADTVDGYDAADLLPLTEPQVEGYITNGPINLAAASSMAGVVLSTGPHTVDTDTNAGTLCNPGEYLDGDGSCHTYSTSGGDAATLDGLDSTQLLRSDVDDEVDGALTFNGPVGMGTAPASDAVLTIHDVVGSLGVGARVDLDHPYSDARDITAFEASAAGRTGSHYDFSVVGLEGTAEGDGVGKHYGIKGTAVQAGLVYPSSAAYGVYGVGSSENISIGVRGDATTGNTAYGVYGTATGATTSWGLYTPDAAHVGGDLSVNGSIDLGDATTDLLTLTARLDSNILPSTTGALDLGSSTQRWRDLYLSGEVKNSSGSTAYILNRGWEQQEASFWITGTGVFGEDVHIGGNSGSDDDSLYFDGNVEFLMWDESESSFKLSDDVSVSGNGNFWGDVAIGNGGSGDDDILYFDAGTESLMWDESGGKFVFSADTSVYGALYASQGGTGFSWNGLGGYGVWAGGSTDAGWFQATDGTGEVWLGTDHRGVYAVGTNYGGFFDDTDTTSNAKVGYSTYKIQGTGAVSFVQNHPEEADRVIVYASPEGDEVATYTRGTARLVNGEARVALGETFRWVTNPELGLTVHLTPVGGWAQLYVVDKSTTEIVVRSAGGDPGAAFDYIVHGLRIGFEEVAVVQEKEREAWIPAMTDHRELYQRRPELERFSAGERFRAMETAAGKAAGDTGAAEALRDAIHEYDPETDGLYLPEVADRLAAAEAEAGE
ncbi:MAG: hypothetical protein AB1Z65_14270 [Candidatus Sulfomarinibacteraceae bacterium]